jgi:hypothetical protein
MLAPKMFLRILTIDSMNSTIHHLLFFKFQILRLRSPCSMHVPMLIIHPHSGKHDVDEGNHGCQVECLSRGEVFTR